ncbi:MAG: NAD(P)H-hydrate dehydratase [Actinomycetota bacterium]|nr:NAD(P)H-hydrate dehydratase [Actinomycetota bacterium]
MKPVLSVAEMRRVDAETAENIDMLMDRAAYGVALAAVDLGAGYGTTVRVLCGKGNNGGDGYVAAAYLAARGARVFAHSVDDPAPNTAASRARERARRNGVAVTTLGVPRPTDVLIDAVVGTGFVGKLSDDIAEWTHIDTAVVAVDIPSGLGGDTGIANGAVFEADITVAFHTLKPGHLLEDGPDLCGEVRVVDIGLSGGEPSMYLMGDDDVFVSGRDRRIHKWSAGAVATVGGAPGLTGAAVFAARAALRAGAGVSTLIAQASTASVYLSAAVEIPTMVLDRLATADDATTLIRRLNRFDVLIVGPGLEPAPGPFVEGLIREFDGAVILDAGALNSLADTRVLRSRDAVTVLTPHAGEFKRLTGHEPSLSAATALADDTGSIVVLKGNPTLVVGDRTIVVSSGGPELATIGSGDVLAGMIGAFVASSPDPLLAVASAVHLHGIAGAAVREVTTLTTPDLLAAVGPTVSAFSD